MGGTTKFFSEVRVAGLDEISPAADVGPVALRKPKSSEHFEQSTRESMVSEQAGHKANPQFEQ